jgi:hypothetical protein
VISSDGGALLLGATDEAIGLVDRFAACFRDGRAAERIEHSIETLVRQRVVGIVLGDEDLIDHDELRHDPVMAVLAGKLKAQRKDCAPVAGKSTLSRLEHTPAEGEAFAPARYHKIGHDAAGIEVLFVTLFLEAHAEPPEEIVIDLDATDDPLHGHQEGRFFHGYYDCYCYLPLYIFCGRHLLAAKLRRADIDASAGAVEEIARIVAQIRARWPEVKIRLRADSGFAREELMAWCEETGVDYVFGLARNNRLVASIGRELKGARREASRTRRPARRFKDFQWTTLDSWSRKRRVIGKAEWTQGRGQPALHCHLARPQPGCGPGPLRGRLLCARRHGEPHQGMPGRPVCRPHADGDHAGQSAPALVRLLCLRARVRAAPPRARRHRARQGDLRQHPPQAPQDRRPGDAERPAREDRSRLLLSLAGAVRPRA